MRQISRDKAERLLLSKLSPYCREVLYLFFLHSFSVQEIAGRLGIECHMVQHILVNGTETCGEDISGRLFISEHEVSAFG